MQPISGLGASAIKFAEEIQRKNSVDSNKFQEVLKQQQELHQIPQLDSTVKPGYLVKSNKIKELLSTIIDGQNKLDGIIKLSLSGKHFGPQELLAIQAGVFKYSQEMELTSKVVEKATSAVKQAMQTQV